MAKGDETPRTNPAEIESLIEQIRGTNLEPGAKEKVERLLRTVLTLVELLGRSNISIKKLRQMIFGRRTEKHHGKKKEGSLSTRTIESGRQLPFSNVRRPAV